VRPFVLNFLRLVAFFLLAIRNLLNAWLDKT